MLKVGLSAPWHTFRNKLAAVFHGDEEVEVSELISTAKGEYRIDITVDNAEKACALAQIINLNPDMGNVKLKVNIRVPNKKSLATDEVDFDAAFEGNPNVSQVKELTDIFGTTWTFIMFKKDRGVVQFYNDNMQDPYGNFVGLISDVARDIFNEIEGVCYSIDV